MRVRFPELLPTLKTVPLAACRLLWINGLFGGGKSQAAVSCTAACPAAWSAIPNSSDPACTGCCQPS